ncbi:hypothetical protein PanWU01x14_112720 [Parasponia andersonii]|uniref:Uncharacterized protein n=1 Tax=Parasponia andersonii TaxID=3476 RepID=A0A2P5CYH8_PARAD|nr:hypothetical protein PanWU01x14_112720 [Parasponia andersonii]
MPPAPKNSTWMLYINRSTNTSGSGIRIILQTPAELKIERALRLRFKVCDELAGTHQNDNALSATDKSQA